MSKDWYTLSPSGLLARGALGVVFGVVVMVWPITSALAFVMLWGFWVLVDSLGSLSQTLRSDATGRMWLGLLGVLGLVAAFLAIVTPAMTAVAATWAVGLWLLVRGGVELAGALGAAGDTSRGLLVLSGVLSVLVGVLLVTNPGRSAIALAFWFGLSTALWGVAHVGLALLVRRQRSVPSSSSVGDTALR
ncbi:DUF308 domain-containing protein [Nocardioides sp. AX2bis]|uniref:DUF308 domain-containing protein n=1 Tax=Nocardioides sp. AX2bis TaxID=2653157 RepID=UPI0012EFC871|nr:DUF308 domain-containing protein [Nocardioides sp. AX2bis]VXB63416.1 membrane hypothetical protein [Nocardioides sp. AX2bis]